MLEFVLPLVYGTVLLSLILGTRVFAFFPLSRKMIGGLFLLKMAAGSAYTLLYDWYYGRQNVDIFNYFRDSRELYQIFFEDIGTFFRMFFWQPGMAVPPDLVDQFNRMDYWSVWGDYALIRVNTLLQFFSAGNIYVHGVFFAFFSLVGLVLLYTLFERYLSGHWGLVVTIFLVPSVLFWGSGVHKEPLVLLGIGILFYQWNSLKDRSRAGRRILWMIGALLLIFLTRWYLVALLIPVMIGYIWTRFAPRYSFWKYAGVLTVVFLLVQGITQWTDLPTFAEVVVQKRQAFQTLEGATNVEMNTMEPTVYGLLTQIPEALSHVFLRPLPGELDSLLQWAVFFENLAILLFLLLPLWLGRSLPKPVRPLFWGSLFFSGGLILLIGWTVNNPGAIIRYKVQYYPLLLSSWLFLIRSFGLQNFSDRSKESE